MSSTPHRLRRYNIHALYAADVAPSSEYVRRRWLKWLSSSFDLWPWQPFQQCALTWCIFVASFIKILPLFTEISRHTKYNRQGPAGQTAGRTTTKHACFMPPPPTVGGGIKRGIKRFEQKISLRCLIDKTRTILITAIYSQLHIIIVFFRPTFEMYRVVQKADTRFIVAITLANQVSAFWTNLIRRSRCHKTCHVNAPKS